MCSLRRGLRCAASAARTGWSGRQHFYGEGEKSTIADGLRLPAKGGLTQFVGAAGPQTRAAWA